ncbi:MAG: pilus assembly protein PilP, partial [Deltaproteobacteria bacterium]
PRTYLDTLDLYQLELIATIIYPKGNWAMVRDAKGVGHVIRRGTQIGTNEGIVQKISEGALVIREKHIDFLGKVTTRNVVKKMATDR